MRRLKKIEKVVLYSDVTSRDLTSLIVLSKYLSLHNLRVKILPLFKSNYYGIPTFLSQKFFSPDAVITPSFNYYRSPEVSWRSKLSNSLLILMPSEQYVSDGFLVEKMPLYDSKNEYKPDYYFVGSHYYAELLHFRANVDSKKVFIVGQMKLDSAAQYRKINNDRGKCLKIIFVSDYSPATWTEDTVETLYKNYKIDFTMGEIQLIKKERQNAILSAIKLSRKDGYQVTFRLHPGEDPKVYQDAFAGSNVKISDPSTAFAEDIAAHDLALGYTTTSVFEIIKTGVPFISIHDFDYPKSIWRDYLDSVTQLSNRELTSPNLNLQTIISSFRLGKLHHFCYGIGESDKPCYELIEKALRKIELTSHAHNTPDQFYSYSLKFMFLGIFAGILRLIILCIPQNIKLRVRYGTRFYNLVHPMHNFTSKQLNGTQPLKQYEKSSRGNWKLGDFGWEFKE